MRAKGPIKVDPDGAIADLRDHTLKRMAGGDFARLVFLAGTRNYNTMEYKHDGLAFRWGTAATSIALEHCHRQVFNDLAISRVTPLYDAFEEYLLSMKYDSHVVISAWLNMQGYRMTIPLFANPYFVELYFANMAAILEGMEDRYGIQMPQSYMPVETRNSSGPLALVP